ncbi:16596_t:CDS:2, partial [Dentiscutata heterogama]
TLAHYDENSGPFEYSIQQDKKVQNKTGKNQYKDYILKAAKEYIDEIIENNLSKEEATIKLLQKKKDTIQRLGGSGKTSLVSKLFNGEYFEKQKKQCSGSNFWNGYKGQEIVFFDEFYTKINWSDMVNVLNDTSCPVKIKYGTYKTLFKAKFVFMTSTKPPEEAYNFGQHDSKDNNKYLCDYPNSRCLDKYHLECEQFSITNQIEDPQIESSNLVKEPQKEILSNDQQEDLFVNSEQKSVVDSEDSNYFCKRR